MFIIFSDSLICFHKQKIQNYTLKAGKLQLELQTLKTQYQQYKKRLAKRIRAIYKMGYGRQTNQVLKLLISSENFGDLLKRYKYASATAATDQQLLQTLENQQTQIIETHTTWQSQIRQIETVSAQLARSFSLQSNFVIALKKRAPSKCVERPEFLAT